MVAEGRVPAVAAGGVWAARVTAQSKSGRRFVLEAIDSSDGRMRYEFIEMRKEGPGL
jgi:hypothetical protein